MEGRARFSKLAVPYLDRLPEGVFQTLMYHALAERTGIDVESLKRLQPPPAPRPDPDRLARHLVPRHAPPLDPAELPPEADLAARGAPAGEPLAELAQSHTSVTRPGSPQTGAGHQNSRQSDAERRQPRRGAPDGEWSAIFDSTPRSPRRHYSAFGLAHQRAIF